MEVRKTNRVILESESLKSPGFSTNNSITSLILNEDQNQLESELSFLEDESELKSLSPQPQPDLLIDLGDAAAASATIFDDVTMAPKYDDLVIPDDDDISIDVIHITESELVIGVDFSDLEFEIEPENLASTPFMVVTDDNESEPDHELEEDELTEITNVKEQKMKEMTIMEKSTSSTSSSSSSIISSSVVTNNSSTTMKSSNSSVKAAKEAVTATATTDTAITATNVNANTTTTVTTTATKKTASLSNSLITAGSTDAVAINTNNTNILQDSSTNAIVNAAVNETTIINNTKTSGTNKKKSKNNNKSSSESISVRRSFDGDLNCLVDSYTNAVNDDQDYNDIINDVNQDQVQIHTENEDISLLPISDKNPITNLSRPSSIHRPKSCLGIPNEVANKRWNSGESSKTQNGAHIVFIPGDDFSGVSVNKLKSSFTKFDNLAKKEMKSTVANNNKDQAEQQSPEVTAPQPNHICKGCNREVFQMELIKAEKADWHKNCFRCTICNKSQTLDSYSSNEGKIYCKPHFRELFKPKTVEMTEEEISEKLKRKVEVIIRESEPVPLPPGVVRASEKSGTDIQDLKLDVKSKFELFESLGTNAGTDESKENRVAGEISEELKKAGSVQSRLAKYQSRVAASTLAMETGVADEDLAGGGTRRRLKEDVTLEEEGESSGDEVMDPRLLRKTQPVEEINLVAVDEVRSKWELGINSKKEEISEARREEQSRFRNRLLMGKNTQMKDMYEKACEETALEKEQSQQSLDLELMKSSENKAKDLKQLFEKGEVLTPQSESKLEKEVFESEIAKNSRSLFKEMDKCVVAGTPMSISPVNRQNQFKRQESASIRKHEVVDGAEIVKSSDVTDEVVSPEDISSKFKFFETFKEKMSENKSKERFRMTPPRDFNDKEQSPPVEIYRDPNIIRSSDPSTDSDIPVTRTASKMLSVFRQLEQEQNESGDAKKNFKPLKEFTPPRDTLKSTNGHADDSGDSEEGEDSGEDEDVLDDSGERIAPCDIEKDELLKQVGSLARATSLRLKFERWEREENAKNKEHGFDPNHGLDEDQEGSMASIESTKDLRAKFENYKDSVVEQEKMQKMRRGESLKVKRFVELTNNTGSNMENCVTCEKRVYVMEKVEAGGKVYHKTCFRCSHCKALLRMDTFTSNKGTLFCIPHFKQLFKVKGNYDEGFGHETQRQIFEKKKRAEAGAEEKEN